MKFAMITFAAAAGSANALTGYNMTPNKNLKGPSEGCDTEMDNSGCSDVADCEAKCDANQQCIGFVTHPWGANMKTSVPSGDCLINRDGFEWYQKSDYTVGDHKRSFYEEVPSRACSGRNELGAQEGITVEEAKAWCDSTSSCVSFEKMEDRRFQFSTSCIKSTSAFYADIDLFIKSSTPPPTAEPTVEPTFACINSECSKWTCDEWCECWDGTHHSIFPSRLYCTLSYHICD